jgi:Protein of unknown function (DUF2889)
MTPSRTAERVKKLKIEPVDDTLLRFRASLEDTSQDGAGGEIIHSLSIEGTISLPDLVIRSIEPHASHHPYAACGASLAPVRKMVGIAIGPGFRAKVQDLMGGTSGCSHFLALAIDLSASHTLSLFLRMRDTAAFSSRNDPDNAWIGAGLKLEPRLENACIALTSASPVIIHAKQKAH